MSKQYWHCEACGGNFDIGEKCDCDSPITPAIVFGETEEVDEEIDELAKEDLK